MDSSKVFGQGAKVAETDKLNIDSIIARLLEGKNLKFFSAPIYQASFGKFLASYFSKFKMFIPTRYIWRQKQDFPVLR